MNIKTKFLIDQECINILKEQLHYDKIKVLSSEMHKDYELHPETIKEYIYNQKITIRYHLLVDTEEIYVTIVKRGIHFNGDCDFKEITIFRDDLEVLYSNSEINNTKKKKRKYKTSNF